MERFDLTNLIPGTQRAGAVCLSRKEGRTTRNGEAYLDLELANATGRCGAKIWPEAVSAWEEIEPGVALDLNARIKAGYRGGAPELEILSFDLLPGDHPVRMELNPVCPVPREDLEARFDRLIFSLRRTEAFQLVELLLRSRRDEYFAAPAAIGHHHNYIGGLAEHSIEVAEMAVALAATKPYAGLVDRDAVIVASLVHDIGKLKEYAWEGVPISISRQGHLRSHVSRGAEMIALDVASSWLIESGTVLEEDVELCKHVCEAHHYRTEWGSMVEPRCLEALIVHLADCSSAKMRAMADDVISGEPDAEHWIEPKGWRKRPVWHAGAAIAAAHAKRPRRRGSDDRLPWEKALDVFGPETITTMQGGENA